MAESLAQLVDQMIEWFGMPTNGLVSVFLVALVSATLLPMGSEPAVFAFVKLNPEQFWITVLVATLGNTLGGVVNYTLGRAAKHAVAKNQPTRYLRWLERFGPKTLFLSFLPVVGDPLCAVAGWLRMPLKACVLWMAAGRLVRYTTMTGLLLWVPNTWWQQLLGPLAPAFGL
jgi:membrane protein YqaA with SNARE-associated domain